MSLQVCAVNLVLLWGQVFDRATPEIDILENRGTSPRDDGAAHAHRYQLRVIVGIKCRREENRRPGCNLEGIAELLDMELAVERWVEVAKRDYNTETRAQILKVDMSAGHDAVAADVYAEGGEWVEGGLEMGKLCVYSVRGVGVAFRDQGEFGFENTC